MGREINFNIENIAEIAKEFIEETAERRVILFDGEMGAGKTTFISEICRLLGADDDFGSPTFSIINEYADGKGNPIYHFDFYRIESLREAQDIGVEDYFYSGHLCLAEWPDRIEPLLPEDALTVRLTVNPDGSRKISY
ncbi:MAG: tRNA (adenosine(37)-N6)-threonylcarbamoyltransferase complex ATPase subunit type 1 TsaE [Muribaculaceae bacterium]|nr:tRNA (adenosine(37)-N6)-threonylcarbamoyltransferase complex ATPase subunit type 1 TsaE [Muribaculaceae bacterium]